MPGPSSNLLILRRIPWDNTYTNIRRFNNINEQYQYMVGKIAYTVGSDYSYIKNKEGTPIRVPLSEAQLLNCNYLMYQNQDYGDKWFYAFITKVEYVADGTTYIYWEEDLIQSWYFAFDVQPCLIERQHVNDDSIGANTVPEGLECGPYVCNSARSEYFGGMSYAFLATQTVGGAHEGVLRNRVYSGLVWRAYQDWGSLEAAIQEYIDAGLEGSIVCVYQCPTDAVLNGQGEPDAKDLSWSKPLSNIDGYVPKNKKLFCYPYNYLIINNNAGITNELMYELWPGSQVTMRCWSVAVTMPEAFACPRNYRGLTWDVDNGVPVTNWPQCGFSGDTFKAWWAQNKTSMLTSAGLSAFSSALGGGAARSGVGAVIGGAIGSALLPGAGTAIGAVAGGAIGGAVSSLFNSATGALVESQHMAALPDSCKGQASTPSLMAAIDRCAVTFYAVNIRAEYAKRIDDYFSMFGYKLNRIEYPNTTGRKSWNFVKCNGANVEGDVPLTAKLCFENALNNGVTFWHVDDVGNYSLDNSIV